MSYLDNLIAWADNLFSTESREALSEATLLYVIASEILGPQPVAVTPRSTPTILRPARAVSRRVRQRHGRDRERDRRSGRTGAAQGGTGTGIPAPQTFYFKIPSNAKLLGYWTTVADRLFKLRHCQNIAGAPLELALFDAPIDPGLLIAAQAAGVDLSSVLSDVGASAAQLPLHRAVPAGARFRQRRARLRRSLQAALEKSDAGALVAASADHRATAAQATATRSSTGRCNRPRAASTPQPGAHAGAAEIRLQQLAARQRGRSNRRRR